MMRSLFSGVSGLRTHQTRMDLIGHNISNVNTIGFKGARMTFADAISQRLSPATGANPEMGRVGTNPMQIGLGVSVGGIDNLMHAGAPQRTDRPFDLAIRTNGFFIVNSGTETLFTRAGNIQWDAAGNFHISGNQLMGWPAIDDPEIPGSRRILRGQVEPLRTPMDVRQIPALATTQAEPRGNLNPRTDPQITMPFSFYDSLGNRWSMDMRLSHIPHTQVPDQVGGEAQGNDNNSWWRFEFLGANGQPAGAPEPDGTPTRDYVLIFPTVNDQIDRNNPVRVSLGINPFFFEEGPDGELIRNYGTAAEATREAMGAHMGFLNFDMNGNLQEIRGGPGAVTSDDSLDVTNPMFALNILTTPLIDDGDLAELPTGNLMVPGAMIGGAVHFPHERPQNGIVGGTDDDGNPFLVGAGVGEENNGSRGNLGSILLDFRNLRQMNTMDFDLAIDRLNGNRAGTLDEVTFDANGNITGLYSNGQTLLLGQIALAEFLNPAGLERAGSNMFRATANSGPFNEVGTFGEFIVGATEMSNVDLATEFVEMITTQRGFQAGSRIITTSDDMLQELINLRR